MIIWLIVVALLLVLIYQAGSILAALNREERERATRSTPGAAAARIARRKAGW